MSACMAAGEPHDVAALLIFSAVWAVIFCGVKFRHRDHNVVFSVCAVAKWSVAKARVCWQRYNGSAMFFPTISHFTLDSYSVHLSHLPLMTRWHTHCAQRGVVAALATTHQTSKQPPAPPQPTPKQNSILSLRRCWGRQ